MSFRKLLPVALLAAAFACKEKGGGDEASSEKTPSTETKTAGTKASPPVEDKGESEEFEGVSGRHRKQDNWVPNEFRKGSAKWKDAGVYVDGKPMGIMRFGELPRDLETVWIESIEDLDFKPGDKGPRKRIEFEPRFRLTDYLTKLGVDVGKIKELHIYGGGGFTMRVTGDDLRNVKDTFFFDYGGLWKSKPLIRLPPELKVNTSFDKIWAIVVYVDKKPPVLTEKDIATFDGEEIKGVPYYGEPIRGGVRVYKDDRLVFRIKRRKLEDKPELVTKGDDGMIRFKLMAMLEEEGVDTSDIVAGEVIRRNERHERFSEDEIKNLTFVANTQAGGSMLMGKDNVVVNALALYTKPIPEGKAPRYARKAPPPKPWTPGTKAN